MSEREVLASNRIVDPPLVFDSPNTEDGRAAAGDLGHEPCIELDPSVRRLTPVRAM